MCPWCWVGKRHFERALEQWQEGVENNETDPMESTVTWLPYLLDQDLDEHGTRTSDDYAKNYGDDQAGERMKVPLRKAGQKVGIDFAYYCREIKYFYPTLRSHCLLAYCREQFGLDKQNEMVEELFCRFNQQGLKLTCRSMVMVMRLFSG